MFAPGPGEDPSPDNQVHDFNPGIASNGLFWTARIPDRSVDVSPGGGTASMHVANLQMMDFFNIVNALVGSEPPIPASVSFDVRWMDPAERVKLRDAENDFAGAFRRTSAAIEWSGQAGDFQYVSDPADTSESVFAEVGHERNGVFFP